MRTGVQDMPAMTPASWSSQGVTDHVASSGLTPRAVRSAPRSSREDHHAGLEPQKMGALGEEKSCSSSTQVSMGCVMDGTSKEPRGMSSSINHRMLADVGAVVLMLNFKKQVYSQALPSRWCDQRPDCCERT